MVKTKRGEYKILLERVQKENNPPVWLFSSETLKLVPQIYDEIDVPWLEKHLPAAMTETRVAGQPLYRWIIPLVVLPLVLFLGWLFTRAIFALVREPMRKRFGEAVMSKLRGIGKPLMLLFASGAVYVLSLGSASLLTRLFWTFMASTMAVVGLTWLILYLIDAGAEIIERRRPEAANAVIRLSATLMKALAVVVGLVVIFYYFAGINLTAVVAGLGIGGIAVAFAAQKTIENFFGGLFLVWDKPIRLGDYCKAGEHQGTVEHIGIRSTQIRTPSRTVVSIPNGLLSSISVENLTLRDRILFKHTLNLRYETTADQLRYILAQIRELAVPAPPGRLHDGPHPLRRLRAIVDGLGDLCLRPRDRVRSIPRRPGGPAAADHGPRRVERQRLCLPVADRLHEKGRGARRGKGPRGSRCRRPLEGPGRAALPGSQARKGFAARRHAGVPAKGLGAEREERG